MLVEIGSLQRYADGRRRTDALSNDLQALGRQRLLSLSLSNTAGAAFTSTILMSILLACRKHTSDFQTVHRLATQALDGEYFWLTVQLTNSDSRIRGFYGISSGGYGLPNRESSLSLVGLTIRRSSGVWRT